MKCPRCAATETQVKDSRPTEFGSVRRRRLCHQCGHRFTTHEIPAAIYRTLHGRIAAVSAILADLRETARKIDALPEQEETEVMCENLSRDGTRA